MNSIFILSTLGIFVFINLYKNKRSEINEINRKTAISPANHFQPYESSDMDNQINAMNMSSKYEHTVPTKKVNPVPIIGGGMM